MKKVVTLLILLSMFIISIPKVYAAEVPGTINEVLVPTQKAIKNAVLFIPISSCILNSDYDYCQFYVDLNGNRVSEFKVTRSTPKINNNRYYQIIFDYSRAYTKGKENAIRVTTGSSFIETIGYTSEEKELVGTCNSKANMVKAQGIILTRKVGNNKVERFEELINIINGPDGFDVAAGTGIEFPIYTFYTYQGSEYLDYFSFNKEMTLDMYSPYMPEKVNKIYPYDSSYGGHKVRYEALEPQEIKDVVLFTEALLEQLEGKGIKSDVEKGTAGEGYVEIPNSCITKYKWRKKETVTYSTLGDCVETGRNPNAGEKRVKGKKVCNMYCECFGSKVIARGSLTSGTECDCANSANLLGEGTVIGACEKYNDTRSKCRDKAYNEVYKTCKKIKDKYYFCEYKRHECYWFPSFTESIYDNCMSIYENRLKLCGELGKMDYKIGHNCNVIEWITTGTIDETKLCSGTSLVYGICKVNKKTYTHYEYYDGVDWIPGDSNYAKYTVENLSGQPDVEKIGQADFCSYYKPGEISDTSQTTGLINYILPLAYVEKGTGYVYNNDNKTTAKNPFINSNGERKIYTDLKSDDIKNYPLRIIGNKIGFNKYSYSLTCDFNLLANGLFEPKPGQQGLIVYRPIDPKDPFPKYAPLANWQGKEQLITKLGYGVYTINPEYEIHLTSVSIDKIRSYNDTNEYLDYNINEKGESVFIHKMFSNLFRVNKK